MNLNTHMDIHKHINKQTRATPTWRGPAAGRFDSRSAPRCPAPPAPEV